MPAPAATGSPAEPPRVPALVAGARSAAWRDADGRALTLDHAAAAARARRTPPLVVHAPANFRRLGCEKLAALDLLELFAFVRPARFAVPTPQGLAAAVGLDPPPDAAAAAAALSAIAARLLAELSDERDPRAGGIAMQLGADGWLWAPAVCTALGVSPGRPPAGSLAVWRHLDRWTELAPEAPPGHRPVTPEEARQRLAGLLGADAEERPQQADYASAVSAAFAPCPAPGEPTVVLAEAGTGTGKTLGYVAPASLWAEKNDGPVWISTYTRNLQQQLDTELDRLYPDPGHKARRVAIRKGRDNYLCLRIMDDAVSRTLGHRPLEPVALGLMARWALATRDGDLGGDLPAWLVDLFGDDNVHGLADRRRECTYSACVHYDRCFVEKGVRRAQHARIVVANHALVLTHAALRGRDDGGPAARYVFDEGQHLFNAADSAFAGRLTGAETAELRRWLLGGEARRGVRGLQERASELVRDRRDDREVYARIIQAARILPAPGWRTRLSEQTPAGSVEAFLHPVWRQVYARNGRAGTRYRLETLVSPPAEGVAEASAALHRDLGRLEEPMRELGGRFRKRLDDEADALDSAMRRRLDGTARGLERQADRIRSWIGMLDRVVRETPDDDFVDWFGVDRKGGRDVDVGMHRHWIDPMRPFAEAVLTPSHGAVITSATLRDGTGNDEADWAAAAARTGTRHLQRPAIPAQMTSPFDYAELTRVLIVDDVDRDDKDQVAAAYRELFRAAGGGGLGLFTAISRLRDAHRRIAGALEESGLPLLAQHVDGMNVNTLLDIFRAETDTCLLGTDAVRDGIDVPGRALRLIVFDRVPWPPRTILHNARRDALGGWAHDRMIVRLHLKQAFGRLVRRADDRGVFVLLDGGLKEYLYGAFPATVRPKRTGLADAVAAVRAHVGTP